MHQLDKQDLAKVAEYWAQQKGFEAGGLVCEKLQQKMRPKWAANILAIVLADSHVEHSLFNEVLSVADKEDVWDTAHEVFDNLRREKNKLSGARTTRQLSREEDLLASVLTLAEDVAKVTYNAANPPDPFDTEAGAWIGSFLRSYVEHRKDEQFSLSAWSALSGSA